MVIQQLSTKLPELLELADEVWIAVALATDDGLEFVRKRIRPGVTQYFLIGINMGTPISVLKTLAAAQTTGTKARICQPDKGIFHPKLYLFRTGDQLKAILGSANLTLAGLSTNQELSTLIDDTQTCHQLQRWFLDQYKNAYPITERNISSYEHSNGDVDGLADSKGKKTVVNLEKMIAPAAFNEVDFSDRYFKKEHHMAFRQELWNDLSIAAQKERKKTVDRFMELHEQIFHRFSEFNLAGLHHNVKNHIVSNHYHTTDRIGQDINAMWLSYGKSQKEISQYHQAVRQPYDPSKEQQENDYQSFMNHARLQIRIELEQIGIWILFGKNKGSIFDRNEFFNQMRNESYREDFFTLVKTLPEFYWVSVDKTALFINEINTPDELYHLCRLDHPDAYFIIGRDYNISDPAMSETMLPETTLEEFRRLYPIYKTMRHYL